MTGRSEIALERLRALRRDHSARAARIRQIEARVAAIDPDPEVQAALAELAALVDDSAAAALQADVAAGAGRLAVGVLRERVAYLGTRAATMELATLAAQLRQLADDAARADAVQAALRGRPGRDDV